MNLSINSVAAMNIAQVALSTTQEQFTKYVQDIASGNFSQLNPSDIYVSDKLNIDTMSSYTAIENAQQGINLISVADGALANVSDTLGRIKELTTQAANDVYSEEQRAAIQTEIDELTKQINQTMQSVKYNGKDILNVVNDANPNEIEDIKFMVGTGSTEASQVVYNPNINMDELSFDVSNAENARVSMEAADKAISAVSDKRSEISATQNSLMSSIEINATNIINNQSAYSQIADTDYASAMIGLLQNQIAQESLIAVLNLDFKSQGNILNLIMGTVEK